MLTSPPPSRLTYLLYRCHTCRRLLTRLDITNTWEYYERTGEPSRGICPCGGSKISPANASVWEELTTPSIWKLWYNEVFLPWWSSR